jgi:hypothetical protein
MLAGRREALERSETVHEALTTVQARAQSELAAAIDAQLSG